MDQLLLRILNEIDNAPYEEWSLERAAEVAGYSPFHFHRIFKAATGVTFYRFVRTRQMHAAARHVIREDRVEDVAYRFNYSSPGAFSRSFKNFTGISPAEFRENPVMVSVESQTTTLVRESTGDTTMQGKTIEVNEPINVIGVQVNTSPPADMNISVAWRGLSDRWTRLAVKGAHPRSFGLQEYGADSRNRSQGILYTACVEVLPDSPVPQGAIKRTIPAGRYAVFTHTGPTEALDHTFQHVYGAGLAALGVTATGEFDLEVYDERFKEDDTNSQLDIYVPIE